MLRIENISKSYGDKNLFTNIHAAIGELERIGLIGVNGTGKSSFLKVIAGIDDSDQGEIKHAKDYQIEYIAQEMDLYEELTVIEQIYYGESEQMRLMRAYEQALLNLEKEPENESFQGKLLQLQQKMDQAEAWEANANAKTILTKLGITAFDKKVHELSGGQRKRVAIAKALIQPADLLILDEPTNHLDHETVEWLEKYLQSYRGSILLVTHDRYFLNRVTNRIFELDKGNLYVYEGNYELFLEKKAEREAQEISDEQKHRNTLKRELAWLKRGAKARSTKQRARVERAEEMKEKKFDTKKENLAIQAGSKRLGNDVIDLTEISKDFGRQTLIHDFSYQIIPGDRIGIIGPNGTGKTTLLNMMAERISPDKGEVKIGETVRIGYYTQDDEDLDGDLRIIEYIKEVAEVMHTADGQVITAEQLLEQFLFPRAQQWSYIRTLSGGEKRRLYLLKVLMHEPNVLFLDEPTNDLDTQTLAVLEEYLESFPGVVVTVSHDRYFLDRIVDKLFVFKGEGEVSVYYGNYSEFLETNAIPKQTKASVPKESKAAVSVKTKKKLSYMEQREWETIEDEITQLESRLTEIEQEIAEAGSDIGKVQPLFTEQQEVEDKLEEKMQRWEELSLLKESFESGK
ncbi:multidrug ABC transporter ATP-binding protein [Oceanobacillus oncorhynchi subsp. incaldanensis]|uniref:Putative ABC transporter ATP-binding protein YjjK n=1 Tax=Oceanobacillus oncorhynchi TaxID=545501 RepID=A0A0A1MWA3_9BACI|nr:ABC-F family ATP-binding cassette domain-containing protein [Oceanobacillus oncorhynchi]GIO17753.1 multidrug ABC transporter ATP-binding protein [Oceanobacillus oncorhynchi subsp. incaldanensis]CEI83136.1 putative ABC transporter ATP-binding protein YjjK [Oceanobacillus oncorhynchi]